MTYDKRPIIGITMGDAADLRLGTGNPSSLIEAIKIASKLSQV